MVRHTPALSCSTTASSKQAHKHTALSTSTTPAGGFHHPERATHNAGQEICRRFNLGRCNKGAECYFAHKCWVTGCGGDHSAKACPRAAPCSGPCSELQRAHTTLRRSNFEHELRLHPDKAWVTWLLDGIDNGVSIGYTSSVSPLRSRNLYLLHMHIRMWSMPNLKRRSLQAGSSVHLQNHHSTTCAPLALVWFPKRMESGEPYFTSQHHGRWSQCQ